MTPYAKSGATGTAFADIDEENEANVRRRKTALLKKEDPRLAEGGEG